MLTGILFSQVNKYSSIRSSDHALVLADQNISLARYYFFDYSRWEIDKFIIFICCKLPLHTVFSHNVVNGPMLQFYVIYIVTSIKLMSNFQNKKGIQWIEQHLVFVNIIAHIADFCITWHILSLFLMDSNIILSKKYVLYKLRLIIFSVT